MIRYFLAISASVIAILCTSCGCCTGDSSAPPLRSMPSFREIPTTTATPAPAPVQVEYSK